jgi:hypothetical protein
MASRRRRRAEEGDPPTVAEVRAIRAKMWKEAGGTIRGLMELVAREAAALREGGTAKRRRRGRPVRTRRAATPRPRKRA